MSGSRKPNSPLQDYPLAGFASPQTFEALWDWVAEFLSGYEADPVDPQEASMDPPMQYGGRMGDGIRLDDYSDSEPSTMSTIVDSPSQVINLSKNP
ncbi:MAG: hypothetical protein GY696_18425 [Gammaproteobacteria bacterium]|nr:hypothetical protein [Gammaproteobacteria bacterium]